MSTDEFTFVEQFSPYPCVNASRLNIERQHRHVRQQEFDEFFSPLPPNKRVGSFDSHQKFRSGNARQRNRIITHDNYEIGESAVSALKTDQDGSVDQVGYAEGYGNC